MAEDVEELEFVIPAYTPETMPLPRLLEYLKQIAEVVGVADDMHLIRIEPSSTKPVFKMPRATAAMARERAGEVRLGRGSPAQRMAYTRIRHMVSRDSSGQKPACLNDRSGVILSFFPVEDDANAVVATVRQATTFDGELLRIGGPGEYSAVLMQDLSGEVFSGFTAPRALAKQLGARLFEPLRVTGVGNWDRTRGGQWKLSKMLIQAYEPLVDEPADEVVRRLQAARVIWPHNADALLQAERGGDE